MAYQVLARKWRPRNFSEVLGQGHVLRALINALDSQRLHHAYLFTGTRGVGKTSLARVLAKSLNCEKGVTSTPCGVCSACVEVDEGRYVDLIEVDAASRSKVDETRELLDNVHYSPARGRFKVYLIDEVHMFSNNSFNALLKTLEEPPPHVKFLLATTDPKRLPVTVLSRCLQFNLKRLTAEQLTEQLNKILVAEELVAEPAAVTLIARAADGSVRDSLSLLDQAIAYTGGALTTRDVATMLGTVAAEQVAPLVAALAAANAAEVIRLARELADYAPDFAQILGEVLSMLQRIAVVQLLGDDAVTLDESAEILALSKTLSPEDCQLYYQLGLLGRRDLPLAPEPQVGFEMALLRMLAFRPLAPTAVATQSLPAATVSPARASPKPTQPTPQPATAAPIVAPSAVAPSTPPAHAEQPMVKLDWTDTVARLETTGLVRELAKNCALRHYDGRVFELAIPPQFENLRSERQIKGLEQALFRLTGRDAVVRLTVTKNPGDETPAQRQTAAEATRHAAATLAIEQDPNVQALQREFGATIERISTK